MANAGDAQEKFLFTYLRIQRGYDHVIEGDGAVRAFLGLKAEDKCADAIGYNNPGPGAIRITVGESKGTDIDSAVKQLGNAAAGVLEKYGQATSLDLLLVVTGFFRAKSGFWSPGPGYRVVRAPEGRDKYILWEAMGGMARQVHAEITYDKGKKWQQRLNLLPIIVRPVISPPLG